MTPPNTDALAGREIRFGAAYCNTPLSGLSLFNFTSAQLVTRMAAYDNASEFPATVPILAHYLRQTSYRTGLLGKMQFYGLNELYDFEQHLTTDHEEAD